MAFARCLVCAGFLHHSYITTQGIDVYRCTGENSFNDKGRYFIFTSLGPIEVEPVSVQQGRGKAWSYRFVDLEKRRHEGEEARINEELNKRQKLYHDSMLRMLERSKYEKYEDED